MSQVAFNGKTSKAERPTDEAKLNSFNVSFHQDIYLLSYQSHHSVLMTSLEGVLPLNDWVALEYPAIVEDEAEVLKTLEGGEAVAQAEANGQNLVPIVLQPANPLSHFLYAARSETKGLVIELTKHTELDGSVKITSDVKARVSACYKFTGMNDFVYTPNGLPIEDQFSLGSSDEAGGGGGESKELGNLISEDPRFSQVPILNIPPLFSKLDCPVDSILKEKPSTSVQQSKGYGQSTRYAIPFTSPRIPQERDSATNWKMKFPELWKELEILFQKRPIWSEQMLVAQLDIEIPKDALFNLLGAKCYRFRDGPWQKLWIVRGFDPRTNIEARKFQAFIYSLPSNWYVKSIRSGLLAKIRQHFDSTSIQSLNKFEVAPLTKSTLFQCCDFEDASIKRTLINRQNCKEQCSPTTGWLMNEAWSEIQTTIQSRFTEILEQQTTAVGRPDERPEGTESFPAEHLLSYLTDLAPDEVLSTSEGDSTELL